MRRRLRLELKRLRAARGLTQRQVADELEWSTSKIIRIESGTVGIRIGDLHLLLGLYGVEDRTTIDRLVEMASTEMASTSDRLWPSILTTPGEILAVSIRLTLWSFGWIVQRFAAIVGIVLAVMFHLIAFRRRVLILTAPVRPSLVGRALQIAIGVIRV